ncbi:MAG: 50S ribosomal protein L25/general stress protein Ctc [Bacteroidales bacterium]|nr:50S ribosomal protein L25/general stress protein Ctc [Bacteroidales bacterium]
MKTIEIKAHLRTGTGKKDSKNLRSENNVPCVMYGGEEIVHFYTHENNFKPLIYTPNVYIIEFDIDGKKYKATLQDIQFQPVTDRITHMDFKQVFEDKPVVMNIPIKVVGDSVGIKAGGKLRMKRRTIKVMGVMKDLPDMLEIDVTSLEIGMSIKIHDLSWENLEILDPPRAMVVAIITSRMAAKDSALPEDEIEEVTEETGAEEVEATEEN